MRALGRMDRARHASGGPPFRRLLVLAYVGVISHPALDWLNVYGIRLLMPFSPRWFYGDALFIVDPWVWPWMGTASRFETCASRGCQPAASARRW